MIIHRSLKTISGLLVASVFIAFNDVAATDISTEPLNTYSATSSNDVKPNVLFVLDDSGSMNWDFMPDWACSSYSKSNPYCTSTGQDPSSPRHEYLFRNSAYNGVYYNPATLYRPPVAVDSTGALNTTTYPSMTGTSAATGADSSTKPNWKAVKDDAYGIQSSSSTTSNLESDSSKPPYFFTIVAGEYCTSPTLRTCITANAPSASHPYPAKVRWCDSSALTNCRAAFDTTYSWVRTPSPRTATITITGSSSTSVSGITVEVGNKQIMAGTATATNDPGTLAGRIVDQINLCTVNKVGNCQVVGYSAHALDRRDSSNSGSSYGPWYPVSTCTEDNSGSSRVQCRDNVVTITAPGAVTGSPGVTKSGTMTITAAAFAAGPVPGEILRTALTSDVTSYPYPGTSTKAPDRTDCSGTTCTYAEEMTNYANWWTYYRTRMQSMKTAASNAFATIDKPDDLEDNVSRFRLGYMSINNNTGTDFLNLGEFKGSQKYDWYTKLIRARPNDSTPLRSALSKAGRLYAGKFNGQTLNGTTVTDPLQYSCQQNYTILSSDGFWNEGSGYYQMDGSTTVGNQDAALSRPLYDGGTARLQTRTSTLQKVTVPLQIRSKSRSGASWSSWSNTATCIPKESGSYPYYQCQYNTNNVSTTNVTSCTPHDDSGSTGTWTGDQVACRYSSWSAWSNTTSCTAVAQSTGPNYTVATARECETNAVSGTGTSNTLADVAAYYYDTDLRDPVVSKGTGTCTGPIIAPETDENDLCENNVQSNGRDVATHQHMTTFTLGLGAQGKMIYAPNDGKDYWKDTSGDFYDIVKGTTADPSKGICSWQTSGQCNWPTPSSNSNANIDDMWHAAVNGRGTYFSASNPKSLADSLTSTLDTISNTPRPGTAAAAASSNPNVSASDNYVFSSSYKSVEWYGELIRQQITASGTLTPQNWSAMKLLDCATTEWKPSTSYAVGNVYRQGTACYAVTEAYVSGATFDGTDSGTDGIKTDVLNIDENATEKVPVTAPTGRTIYTKGNVAGALSLVPFNWSTLQSAGLGSYFTAPHISYVSDTAGLSQFCPSGGNCLSAAAQSNTTIASGGAAGEALVNFLRGDRSYEGTYFRQRTHVLGDIVSSEARYVQKPLFNYVDANYSAFKAAKASRSGTVYVGANDGMLHAFEAATGRELWAYIPSMVLPDLYKLADKEYTKKHQFFVDASPETGDICPNAPTATCSSSEWKTILVGGLNRGGNGYYALDVTDPANPKLLWEFTHADLGYTYANPRITKLKDGTWVVLVSSGYNNADGVGRLFVLNADSGTLIRTISTWVGTAANPSGVARLSAHASQPMTDNTSTAAYGGDTFGNLWRFDINGDIGSGGYDAHLLATFKDADGNAQPITVKPLEATIYGKPVVFVGTGRYLGTSDVKDTKFQSFYAVRDKLDNTSYGNPRVTTNNFVNQTLTNDLCPEGAPISVCTPGQIVRTSSSNAVDWSTKNGWYIDFLTGGERSSTDPSLGLGTLIFTTITPQVASANACGDPGANMSGSFVYALDYLTGGAVEGSYGVVALNLGSSLVTRPVMIAQADGTVRALIRTSSGASSGTDLGGTIVITPPIKPPSGSATRRVSWRVLTTK